MNNLNPTIDLERQLGQQIYTALQGPVVEEVLRKTKISSNDAYWRSSMEGHCLKVQPELLPDLYSLCQDVKRKLHFEEPVDFYITGDSTVNAFSLEDSCLGDIRIYTREDLKLIVLPADRNYQIRMTGTDEGQMDYYVTLDQPEEETSVLQASYEHVQLTKGREFVNPISAGGGESAADGLYLVGEDGRAQKEIAADGSEKELSVKIRPAVSAYTFTGKARKPKAVVTVGGKTLSADQYELSYRNNVHVGKAMVTASGKGIYGFTVSGTFDINPAGTKLARLVGGKKSLKAVWKKQARRMASKRIDGYQIQYSLKSSFKSGVKSVTVKGYKKTSTQIKKLKARKKYYVRVRTYKTVSGKKLYSPWSAKKAVRIK